MRIGLQGKTAVMALIGTLILIVVGMIGYLNLRSIETQVNDYTESTTSDIQDLRELQRSIGFDGMIHDLKNFVIRGDQAKATEAADDLQTARAALEGMRGAASSESNAAELDRVAEMLDRYDEALDVAIALNAEGKSATEIDNAIKIDDAPYAEALLGWPHRF